MHCCLAIFSAFFSLATHASEKRDSLRLASHPIPDLSDGPTFLPRALLYFSYKFPLRDDGSLTSFSEKEEQRGRGVISEEQLAKALYPGKRFADVREEIRTLVGALDTPFWRDAVLHHVADMEADLDGAVAAWMADPMFTRTEYIGRDAEVHRQNYHGIAIKQIYEPFGFPFEVPCYSNHVEQLGLPTFFYTLPEREFITLLRDWSHDPISSPEVVTYLSDVVENMAKLKASKVNELTAWPQLIGRDTGSFTHGELKAFMKRPDGRLTINPYLEGINYLSKATIKPWTTLMCAAGLLISKAKVTPGMALSCFELDLQKMVDNEPRSLGVIINVDYLVNEKRPLRYSEIKVLDEEEEKEIGKKEPLPIMDHKANLKIDISWDDWSCCSACCCTSMLCGKFYTPERKCALLPSIKTRKGYISLMKINPEEPESFLISCPVIKLLNACTHAPYILVLGGSKKNALGEEFEAMMSISPYKERGIALFSTLWESNKELAAAKIYKEKLYNMRFVGLPLNGTKPEVTSHPGIYIDEAPCGEDKYDCLKLAECRGMNIKSKIEEELEQEADPCAEYENEIEVIFIESEQTDVPVFPGRSYRLRLREEVFATDATRASWRVSSRTPGNFDTSRPCLEQGTVLQKNGDLLMTTITSRDARRHIEITLSDGRKISIQFVNAGLKLGLGDESGVFIAWAVALTVFLFLLGLFTAVVHNRRRARTQQILLNRMRKRLRAEGKL